MATTAALHILRLMAAGVDICNPSTLPAPVLCAAGCFEEIPPGALSEREISQGVDVIFFLAAAEGTAYLRWSGRKILFPPDPSVFNVPA